MSCILFSLVLYNYDFDDCLLIFFYNSQSSGICYTIYCYNIYFPIVIPVYRKSETKYEIPLAADPHN